MCYRPITIPNKHRTVWNDKHLNTFGCGQCVPCIQKKRTEWAFRMHQESKDHAHAYFVTLTYREEELPYLNLETGEFPVRLKDDTSKYLETDRLEKIVYKKDVQNFIKNVRRQQEHHVPKHSTRIEQDVKRKVRYYMNSEYGTQYTKRPHYHGILWGLHPNIANRIDNQKIWTKGNVQIKPIDESVSSYYYLSKYMYKQKNYNIWTFKPFTVMSQKPIIGNRYLETHTDYHIAKGDLFTKWNGKEVLIPRVYRDRLPQWLKRATNEKILEYNKEIEKKELHLYETKKNHHPEILRYFKQQKAENKQRIEQLIFNTKMSKQLSL